LLAQPSTTKRAELTYPAVNDLFQLSDYVMMEDVMVVQRGNYRKGRDQLNEPEGNRPRGLSQDPVSASRE
jgi:hypothetical protein